MTERCSQKMFADWHRSQCSRNAKVERNGRWYCTQHDPERVAAKNEERDERWAAEREARHLAQDASTARVAARLDAIAKLTEIEACCHPDGLTILPDSILADSIRDILERAK